MERVRRFGPLPFDEFMEAALYDEERGFFAVGAGAGRGADFITSPEISPVFGAVVGRALDAAWRHLGEPDPFVVAEVGAGRGALARDVVASRPACAPALRYLLVESSPMWREAQRSVLPLEPAWMVLGPAVPGADDDADVPHQPGTGPIAASVAELPAERFTGVILANELLDNMPVAVLERAPGGWREVRVGERGGELAEVLVAAAEADVAEADRLAPGAEVGARIPLQRRARAWVRQAVELLERGRVVVFDYCDSTAGIAARPFDHWLRTYRSHGRGVSPLEQPGTQDITCDVAVDQLPPPDEDRSQAAWLRAHGLDELVAGYRDDADPARGITLETLTARSRITEAAALTDEAGLGGFRVLEWVAGGRHHSL